MIDKGDTAWVLMASGLVLLMTPGLAFFYAGLVRQKNVLNTMMLSFIAMAVVGLVWVLWGYSLAFGPDWEGWGLVGNLKWFGLKDVSATEAGPYSATIPHQAFMIFQAKFAIITPALITGAIVERVRFRTIVVFLILWSTIVYAPLAHWLWSTNGWLGALGGEGALDFAGGAVVHISAGVAAMAAALIFGRRIQSGSEKMEPANIPFVILGTGLLWFGWFGFNAGSALSSLGAATNAFVVTNTAACTAALTWVALYWQATNKISVVGAAVGAVVGLAAITPAAGFVGPMPAIAIGFVAGLACYAAVKIKTRMGFDDSLDVWAVHGVAGAWGILATGLFVGVGYLSFEALTQPGMGRGEQILWQVVTIGVASAWAFVGTCGILWVLKKTIGLRVSEEEETRGLDVSQHGEVAYGVVH